MSAVATNDPQRDRDLDDFEADAADQARERRLVVRLATRALWRSRGLVLLCAVLGTLYGLYDGLRRPNVYESQAKLLLRLGEREQITGESLLGVSVSRESSPTIQDEIHMLYDEEVFRRVVEHVGPRALLEVEDPRSADGPNTSALVRAVHAVQARLIASASRVDELERQPDVELAILATDALMKDTAIFAEDNSNVITVRTLSTSPGKARYVAGLLLEAFIDRHREQFSLERYLPTYRKKREEARAAFDEARAALADHVEETGFLDLETQRELILTGISETQQRLAAAKSRAQELGRERELTRQALESDRETMSSSMFADLRDRLQTLAIEVPTAEVAVETQTDELARLEAELVRLEDSAEVQAVLGAEVERTGRLFRELSERLSKIEALAQIDVEGDTNLMPLQLPTLPLEKQGPARAKLVVLGGAAGTALGLLLAALRFLRDRRVRFAEQIERDHRVPVLARVPALPEVRSRAAAPDLERAA